MTAPRRLVVELLRRIDEDGAYANLVVPAALTESALDRRDRAMVTDLVYGVTRRRRTLDALCDPHISVPPDGDVRRMLRVGAFQLLDGRIPRHAAVSSTVDLAPRRARGFVNAVLRRVADAIDDDALSAMRPAVVLSYPDWIHDRLVDELGADDAHAAMEAMNRPAPVTVRDDGYVQDRASTLVADAVPVSPDGIVVDMCAAPGGKATAMASRGAHVIAFDVHRHRAGLIAKNAHRTGTSATVHAVVADGAAPPLRPGCASAVLLDAPCSGLGALRRRPDARWRMTPNELDDLVSVQARLRDAAAELLAPDGCLVYSVCTVTAAESIAHQVPPGCEPDPEPLPAPWEPWGSGWRLLPQHIDSDGMVVVRYRRPR